MSRRPLRRLGRVVGVRRLRQPRTKRVVTLRIGAPRRTAPGDLGLPRQLPDFGLPDLKARLDRLVDAEIERWAAALERKVRRRRRRAR